MAQKNEILEIANDSFYVKRESESQPCKFAYLHLAEEASDIYVAYFENREVEDPIVYWWEEENLSRYEKSRRFINEFIGEAYLSLYIKNKKEKPIDKPLWKTSQAIKCGIPSTWWEKIKNINRNNNEKTKIHKS